MKLPETICLFEGCNKRANARGYCSTCYYRLRRNGTLDISAEPPRKWKHRLTSIDAVARSGVCHTCGPVHLISRGNGKWRCYTDVREKSKIWKRKRRQQLKNQLLDQCEICGSTNKLYYDHDHNTGQFRGTLCALCNSGLGFMRDDPELLSKAIAYLITRKTQEIANEA